VANLHRNEGVKLFATFANTIAASVLTIGVFTPLGVMVYGTAEMKAEPFKILGSALICIGIAMLLHLTAQRILRNLQDTP
jgi:hypothetical protein